MEPMVTATDDIIQVVRQTADEFVAACEAPLGDGETAFGRNIANMNRLALMGTYMPSVLMCLQQERMRRERAENALADLQARVGGVRRAVLRWHCLFSEAADELAMEIMDALPALGQKGGEG